MNLSDPRQTRLGVVGLGNFGILHAETIERLADCQLAVVVDRDEAKLASAKDRWPGTQTHTDLGQAIESWGTSSPHAVDGWIVATTSNSHIAVARQILAAGGSVLIEKPLAESVADAESISEQVRPDSSNVMLGHIVLFGSEFRSLKNESKHRSAIQFIDAVRHRPRSTMDAFPGESPFHLTMVHDLYCVQTLMDRAEPTEITAQVHHDSQGRIDLAIAHMRWQNGAIASLTASFLTPPGMPADGFDRIEVFGQDWTARVSPNPRPLELWDDAARHPMTLEIDEASATGMLAEELRCFCRVLRKESEVPIGATYADGLQIQRWLKRLSGT